MIARQLAIAALIYAVLIIQPSLSSGLGRSLYCPWLPAIAIVTCVSLTNGVPCLIWSGLLGLGVDCLSGGKLGIHLILATTFCGVFLMLPFGRRSHILCTGTMTFFGTSVWRGTAVVVHASMNLQPVDLHETVIHASSIGIATTVLLLGTLVTCRVLASAVRPHRNSSVSLSNHWSMLTGG